MPGKEFYRWQVRSFTVLLALDAVARMNQVLRHPKINGSEEQGGLLFGRTLADNTVEVTDFELVRSGHRRGVAYDLSPHERDRIGQRVQILSGRNGPRPIGYFRTHLRPGLFLDQSDVALMTETLDGSGITLAIGMNQQGPVDAGIFFRENDDIDGRQPGLKFPFDAEALRVQGPIEEAAQVTAPHAPGARLAWRGVSRKTLVSGGVYTLAGAILALATITGLHERVREQSGAKASAAVSTVPQEAAVPGASETVAAPPAVFDDQPLNSDESGSADSPTPGLRTPFGSTRPVEARDDAPPFREAAPPAERTASVIPPPAPPLPPPETSLSATNVLPAAPVPVPPTAVTAPPARSAVNVDVSIEPKEEGALKRVARKVPAAVGHVPLLGRLPGLRRDHDENVVAARPYEDLSPRIPAEVSRNLAEQVEVDVDASIDDQGAVRSAEVVRGDDAQLAFLAENAVRASHWKPARSGDRNVAMSVVVHYRFNPGREP